MKITINEEECKKNNLTLNEFLVLLLNYRQVNVQECMESIINKGIANKSCFENELILSENTKDLITSITVNSDSSIEDKDNWYKEVADALREIYPKGRKAGTSYMWRDSTNVIAKRLKVLTVKYGYKFTKEQAIKAAKAYVESFNGDYTYMHLLKYFIMKSKVNASGDTEVLSEFMSYIDNEGQEDSLSKDWCNELV
jgi:hypothetical protein